MNPFVEQKLVAFNEKFECEGGVENLRVPTNLKSFLKSSLKEAILLGIEMAKGAVPGEFYTSYPFDPEYRDGYNAFRTETLSALEELKKTV